MNSPSHLEVFRANGQQKVIPTQRQKELETELRAVKLERDKLLRDNKRLKDENDDFRLSLVYPVVHES